jgi:putative transcriptional regulator
MSPLTKGKFLVAMPTLLDPNFRQTVVLLCEHGPDGALGLIVNRPTEVEVSTLIDDVPALAGAERVFAGGPVAKNGMLVLCRGDASADNHAVLENVFLAQDLAVLRRPELLGPNGEFRCFLGYSGWGSGQLEAELASGAWRLLDADSSLVFDAAPEALWPEMMRRLGRDWAVYASMPPDPSLN